MCRGWRGDERKVDADGCVRNECEKKKKKDGVVWKERGRRNIG